MVNKGTVNKYIDGLPEKKKNIDGVGPKSI